MDEENGEDMIKDLDTDTQQCGSAGSPTDEQVIGSESELFLSHKDLNNFRKEQ